MSVVPSGRVSLQGGNDRLTVAIEGALYGEHQFVFDRVQRVFLRDGRLVRGLDAITSVEVQGTWQGHRSPHGFLLVVGWEGGAEHLYTGPDKEAVSELAAQIAQFLGLTVTFREQPFQRAFRETLGIGGPGAGGIPSPPMRAVGTMRGVTSLWSLVTQLFVGLGLLGMAGWMVYLGNIQTISLVVGAAFVLFGLGLLVSAGLQARRHFRSGGFQLDPGDPAALSDDDAQARFAPALGAARRPVGLLRLVWRTSLLLGAIFFLAGSGVVILVASGQATDNGPMGYLIGLLFAGIGGYIVWEALRQIRTWQAIQASPVFAEAVIQEIQPIGRRIPRYILVYRYQDGAGTEHTGKSHPLKPIEARWWQVLDVAEIQIDRQQPAHSMLVGDRPIRRSTRDDRYPDGELKGPSRWPAGNPD